MKHFTSFPLTTMSSPFDIFTYNLAYVLSLSKHQPALFLLSRNSTWAKDCSSQEGIAGYAYCIHLASGILSTDISVSYQRFRLPRQIRTAHDRKEDASDITSHQSLRRRRSQFSATPIMSILLSSLQQSSTTQTTTLF